MVDRFIKSHKQALAERARRGQQTRAFRRNQVFGLLILASIILLYWLLHTNPHWIFTPGWWRP